MRDVRAMIATIQKKTKAESTDTFGTLSALDVVHVMDKICAVLNSCPIKTGVSNLTPNHLIAPHLYNEIIEDNDDHIYELGMRKSSTTLKTVFEVIANERNKIFASIQDDFEKRFYPAKVHERTKITARIGDICLMDQKNNK